MIFVPPANSGTRKVVNIVINAMIFNAIGAKLSDISQQAFPLFFFSSPPRDIIILAVALSALPFAPQAVTLSPS